MKLRNLLRLMKITTILLLIGTLHVCATGISQTVSLNVKNQPLRNVFKEISRQTGISILCDERLLEQANPVSVDLQNALLEKALQACFSNQPLHFEIANNVIIVSDHPASKSNGDSVFIKPPIDIHGHVTDSLGNPLVGASVTVKGIKKGTSTDENGNFVLKGMDDNKTLVFSYTGYDDKTYRINGQTDIKVFLTKSNSPLNEIEIIAYGTTTRRLNTGDVSVVKSETIAEQPVNNTLEALEGRVPGLVITQAMGVAGGGFTVRIRGQNSIGNGNDPLYIIDGIPYPSVPLSSNETTSGTIKGGNPLSSINPLDIESVSILKDADATSIYGSRGANGVVLITTKKGKSGKTQADISFYLGNGKITRQMKLLNTPQYLQMRREAFANDGEVPDASNAPDLVSWDTTRYTDWQKELIGNTAQISDVQASVSGGNKNTQFLFGMGYHGESTVFPGDFGNQRLSGKLNFSHTSEDQKFKISVGVNYSSFKNNLYNLDLTMAALTLPPDTPPVYDSTGKLNWAGGTFYNPYASLLQKYTGNTGNMITHANLSYQFNSHFQVLLSGGFNNIQVNEILIEPGSSYNPRYGVLSSFTAFSDNSYKTWILEPQIQYKTSLYSGSLQILAGATFEQDIQDGKSIYGFGFSSDALMQDLQAASSTYVSTVIYSNYKYEAFFGRINYNWQDRYLINFTGRRDGSSRFGPGKQFANFGSVGLGWIFSKTAWIQDHAPVLSFGKIRGSYGSSGNDQIGDYQYLDTYSPTQNPYLGTTGLMSTRLSNPNYSWETNQKFETGLELNFWKDRISSSISWYRNRSSNQLVGYPLPLITGQSSVQQNLPATVQNTGWEFELSIVAVKSNKFQWTSSANLTIPSNKLVAYPNIEGSAYANTYVIGQPLYLIKAYHNSGVDPKTGVYTYEDVNQDGNLSYPEDLTTYKKINPVFYGGFQNALEYAGFRLDFFFQFTKQTKSNYMAGAFNAPGMLGNQPDIVLNRWQTTGEIKPIQKYTQTYSSDAGSAYFNSEYYGDNTISDASFIRLKNLSFSYSLNAVALKKIHASMCTIFLQGQNLLTITGYEGLDPENGNITVLPPLRILSVGFRCSF